jgi:hypothetical protein
VAPALHYAAAMRTLAPALLLLAGCAVEAADDVETTAQPLDNGYTTVGCTTAERSKIASAMQLIDLRIDEPQYLECLQGAYLVERYGVIPEDIITRLQELPTTVECVPAGHCGGNAGACATVPTFGNEIPETMAIEVDYLASTTASALAGTIVHEAAHTEGWNHYPSSSDLAYRAAVPNQAAACMSNLDANGWSRHDPYGDAELAVVGGEGGQPFHLRCPAGSHAIGATIDASTTINRIQLRCSDGSVTARAGEYKDSTTTITEDCSSQASLVGFSGRSDSMVRRLYRHCALTSLVLDDTPDPPTGSELLGGGMAGTQWERMCPIGMVVVGATGRSGARIDQVRWLCRDLDGNALPNPHLHTQFRGTKTGTSKLEQCSGHGAIRALWGHAGAEVNHLGAECVPTFPDGEGRPVASSATANRQELDFNGGTGGPVFNKSCPAGMLMVGLRFRSGARIDAIGGLCAEPTAWVDLDPAITNVSLSGGTTGQYSTLVCPIGEFLVGVQTWAAFTPAHDTTTVHAVHPLCRRLDVTLPPGNEI